MQHYLTGRATKTKAVLSETKDLDGQNATKQGLCCQLESLIEGFGQRSRGVRIRGIDVGQGRIKALVAEGLPDEEGVCALLDKQHSRRVLQNVRVLQRLAKPGSPGDLTEQLEYRHPIQLDGLLRVEHETVSIGLADGQP
jgi:hypothetical protein